MKEDFVNKIKKYCDALFYGLSFKDALIIAKIDLKKCSEKKQQFIKKIGDYSRAQAKLELLKEIKDESLTQNRREQVTFLLESCFAYTRESAILAHKRLEHRQNLDFKKRALAQAGDIAAVKVSLVSDQKKLAEWADLE